MKIKYFYAIALVMFCICTSYSQSQKKQPLKRVNYKDNVNAPLTAKELGFLKEVYADKLDEYVLNRPQRLKSIKHLLRNRIKIVKRPKLVEYTKKYSTLKQAGLFDIYNKKLKFDKLYNPNTFNPLKYNLQFYGNGTFVYRISKTDYFIFIKSQYK